MFREAEPREARGHFESGEEMAICGVGKPLAEQSSTSPGNRSSEENFGAERSERRATWGDADIQLGTDKTAERSRSSDNP